MEYNYNSWAGVPPNPALYPNPSPPVMTNSDQSVPQNPNPSSYALGYGGGHEFQGKCLVYRYGQIDGATSSVEATQVYYQDPNVVRLLGSNGPFRTGELVGEAIAYQGDDQMISSRSKSERMISHTGTGTETWTRIFPMGLV
ncbi:hypothetical protein KY290_014028 [Solanum tuberosum]|uniref:Dirigent protein n=1 Tax=Solanum tuberosum TaxID=4113 RepID=A0ABQ7VNG8_SOLTU|nr:hypothetical protein KY289_014129 [Solanum tuberosum]KAH0699210.1 hypothetical protein KY284_013425 [Solanum tuberosum]KAH0770047.1 hypothetical protein KY290_014028 [Solanum tuberosum]